MNFKFYLCVIATIGAVWGQGILSKHLTPRFLSHLSFLWLVPTAYCIFRIWKWYKNKRKEANIIVEERLLFFLNSNNLFQTETIEVYKNGQTKKEKVICNSAFLGYIVTEKEITIRAYKQGDIFTDKMNNLDTSLCALLDLPLENKIDTISYCDYIFGRLKDKRIIIDKAKATYNNTTLLPLSSNLNWNILKQPHLLLAGVTGSGKTTFLNYLIIEMMNCQVKCATSCKNT